MAAPQAGPGPQLYGGHCVLLPRVLEARADLEEEKRKRRRKEREEKEKRRKEQTMSVKRRRGG
jgi:hypothetical protein